MRVHSPTAEFSCAISARDVKKTYSRGRISVAALAGVDIDIHSGRFTAILGPSGSGKSTLMHCLAGLDTPSSGRIVLGGKTITSLGDRKRTKLRRTEIGFIFQSFNLVPVLSVKENILLPLKLAFARPDKQYFAALNKALGIEDLLRRRPHELSGGQQQRVAIARALLPRPKVVFADEPTGNLDSVSADAVLGILQRCVREFGQTVVMVTHDANAAAHADRAIILADGRITGDLSSPNPDSVLAAIRSLSAGRQ